MSDELDRARSALLAINNSVPRKECQILDELTAFDFEKIWNESKSADADHEYIRRKAGIADGLRVFRGNLKIADQVLDGALLVPAYDKEGTLKSWQAIPAEKSARKINAPSTPISGLRFTVGKPSNHDQIIYVCEGVGAAWATYQATSSLSISKMWFTFFAPPR